MNSKDDFTNNNKLSVPYKKEIIWRNVMFALLYHFIGLQSLYYIVSFQVKWATLLWSTILVICANLGITAGAHRLWTHKTYEARLPLKILLCFFYTIAFEDSIYVWSRNHRVHHKFADTDADPHNIKRGFFFAHMGWLMVKKHPDVIEKGKLIDLSDLKADPVVAFQYKYYIWMAIVLAKVMPTLVAWYFWNENFYIAFATAAVLRFLITYHESSMVNSVAHMWGYKPYDKFIEPVDNVIVAYLTLGEGWHNYHHSFPWDYKTGESNKYSGNVTTAFIDFMAKVGLAYNLKTVSHDILQKKIQRTGGM